MTNYQKGIAMLGIVMSISLATAIQAVGTKMTTVTYVAVAEAKVEVPKLSHAQEVWKSALEWCESAGNPEAINKEDLDGTPSYGAWQFKPSTLDMFAKKYGIATTTVMDYKVQEAVVTQMILHSKEINWRQQFPWCMKKIGLPPAK
jgi:hypothetical protein